MAMGVVLTDDEINRLVAEKKQARDKIYYEDNKEEILSRQRKRYNKKKIAILKSQKEYSKTPKGKSVGIKRSKAWVKRNPQKRKAHEAVKAAIRSGELTPRRTCQICSITSVGAASNIEAHHWDYSEPLMVGWLCRSCHRRFHKTWKMIEK